MKRPNRNIEIFSMSVLDLFASALGAFILVAIILFPYFKQNSVVDVEREKGELSKSQSKLEAVSKQAERVKAEVQRQESELLIVRKTEAELKSCRLGNSLCLAQLARTFLMVQIEWTGVVDVDLSVTDASGNVFSWERSNRNGRDFPASKARLSIDVATGPGIEVWLDPDAKPGKYVIEYSVPRRQHGDVQVRGLIFERNGRQALPQVVLKDGQIRAVAATITVGSNGSVSIQQQ